MEPDERLRHEVRLDQEQLAYAEPELVEVLLAVRAVTDSMTAIFVSLTADPSGYAGARAELERLDAERRADLERLGELASKVLRLHESVPEVLVDASEAATPPPASASEPEREVGSPPLPPLSQEAVVAAFRPTTREEKDERTSGARDDKGMLLSLANHVVIGARTPANLDEEVSALERATADARVPQWKRMSEAAQVRWVRILVAWAKALEEETWAKRELCARATAAFRRLRGFSMNDSPGYIHGFARDAEPDGDGWRADAVEMLAGLRGRPRENDTPRPPVVVYDERDTDDERERTVPEDWPYFSYVKGKDVVMLGGEAREERRVALEEAFQCASLTWVPHSRPRLLQSLTERAAQGTVDVILVNKFVAHKETATLERVSVVPIVTVRLGYGITAVKTALEEYFGRRAPNGAG